nr:MAG: ORF1 [TTV-like mini virus]
MPFYNYRRWRYPNIWRRRRWRPRRRPRFRRPRKTLRRRWTTYRKRRRVRKRLNFKKKLKYILLKEFQPKRIHRCKIKGTICLFQCGPDRLNREWTQFMNSYYPPHYQGGGGWSQLKFSLDSLFEQRELLHNKWTKSNVQMPLCRYTGCKLKLYRTDDVDYIVHYSLCLPMLDTVYQHTNAQPNNLLLYKQKVIVPSKKTNPKGKLYKIKHIRPPEQFQTKWYFQADLAKTPLLLITTTACCLDRIYLNPRSWNNNIDINILNTSFFQTPNFANTPQGTQPWQPKPGYWLYGTQNGSEKSKLSELIFVGQTKTYTIGQPIGTRTWATYSATQTKYEYFGNPFHPDFFNGTRQLWISKSTPQEVFTNNIQSTTIETYNSTHSNKGISEVTQDLHTTVRYTPERDTGENEIYLLNIADNKFNWDEPDDADLIYEGYPLWCLLWGWVDWQVKLKKIQQVETNYILVIKTPFTYPKKEYLVPINKNFIDGKSPWDPESIYAEDKQNWRPQVKYQETEIENICKTGPYVAKTSVNSIEAHADYTFYFKWGGCPNDLEHITDPSDQRHYPVPNQILQGPEIQDPNGDPKQELYCFDFRRCMLTKKAADRIKKDSTTTQFTFTGTKMQSSPTKIQTQDPSSEEEETETPPQLQLQQLKRQQHKLRQQLRLLLTHTPNVKF